MSPFVALTKYIGQAGKYTAPAFCKNCDVNKYFYFACPKSTLYFVTYIRKSFAMGHGSGLFQSKNFKDIARKMTIYAGKMSFHAAAIDYLRQSTYHDNGGSISNC